MSTAREYQVIKWKTADSHVTFDFFAKPHVALGVSDNASTRKPVGRTLLVLNVPPFLRRNNMVQAFKNFGNVRDVIFQDHPSSLTPPDEDPLFQTPQQVIKGYQVAYIVFREDSSVKEIMNMDSGDIEPIVIKKICSGLPLWIQQYNSTIVNTETLEESSKEFLHNFEEEEIRRKAEEEEETVDDDGWVTVSRKGKGKRAGAIHTEKMEERLKAKKKRWEKELMNFTPTQVKETRAKQLDELKKKFDEDRHRIAVLRQQRKFKPF